MGENIKILKKYNLWGDAQFDLGYTRSYTEKLISYSGSSRLIGKPDEIDPLKTI